MICSFPAPIHILPFSGGLKSTVNPSEKVSFARPAWFMARTINTYCVPRSRSKPVINRMLELATIFRKLKDGSLFKKVVSSFSFCPRVLFSSDTCAVYRKKRKKEFGALPFRLYGAMKFAVREQLAGGLSTVHVVGYFSYHGGETLITFNSSTCFRKQS